MRNGRPSRQERLRQYFDALHPGALLLTYTEIAERVLADGTTPKQVRASVKELRRYYRLLAPVLHSRSRYALQRLEDRCRMSAPPSGPTTDTVTELRRRANAAQIKAFLDGDETMRIDFIAARLRRLADDQRSST